MNPLSSLLPAVLKSRPQPARPSAQPSSLNSRVEVCPPELWPSSATLWGRAKRWLSASAPWMPEPSRPANRLARVKAEFQLSVNDLDSTDATRLTERIQRARSLRELWHLRSTLYGVVAMALSQSEAEQRLARLNRHFPTRLPRSGFAPLAH